MFESILGKVNFEYGEIEEPACFSDLNLRQLIRVIMEERSDYDLKPYFYQMDVSKEDILYRHEVMKELEKETVYRAVNDFSIVMCQVEKYLEYYETVSISIQKSCWLLNAIHMYEEGLLSFIETLQSAELDSEGFRSLLAYLSERVEEKQFTDLLTKCREVKKELGKIRFTLDVKKDKIFILPTVNEELYAQSVRDFFGTSEDESTISALLDGKLELTELEQILLKRVEQKYPAVFHPLREFGEDDKDFIPEKISLYHKEIQFYLAFIRFRKDMERFGFSFTYPEFSEEPPCICGLYDLALAHKNAYEGKEVVVNDAEYQGGELFFVLTGPNQGGKTTFARALGQIIYFSKIGLPVAGEFCKVPLFAGIMTHFEMEESMMSGEGKLKEELGRLKPMLERTDTKQFVIINELFTTAATYDATIMGKRVLNHFVKDGCYGIYVTHISELAQETKEIVSLVASVDRDSHQRTFRIQRKKAEGIGYISALVDKYRLTYQDIVRRLEGGRA